MTAERPFHQPYESRKEYHQTPEEVLVECNILADALDELMEVPVAVGSDIQCTACVDETGSYISRSFGYIEGGRSGEWAWPLVEKSLDISYQRNGNNLMLTTETYRVRIDTVIHQQNLDHGTIPNFYEITFFGSDRSSVIATIETPNLTDANEEDFVTRQTTPYDHGQLCDELSALDTLLQAQQREDRAIAQIE